MIYLCLTSGGSYLLIVAMLLLSTLAAEFSFLLIGPAAQQTFISFGNIILFLLGIASGFDIVTLIICVIRHKPIGWVMNLIFGSDLLKAMGFK